LRVWSFLLSEFYGPTNSPYWFEPVDDLKYSQQLSNAFLYFRVAGIRETEINHVLRAGELKLAIRGRPLDGTSIPTIT
jgi:hypothetical protein